ncbi:RNA polymerase sigma factor [Prevotella sp. P2-180]|uniref:RNA polymerase sigma factor n=1 Tax=Prevotella sp. P2-180 TaxID=2024224 RepID=UPI000B96A7A6|nr:sigma-70 family RNA polymerase sigma factor [Prevotella sp. P2-180]MCI6337820.1 sigma-70 family RNA polymerase sigma factor [Prevotella sp.]MCI7090121.1 sigma-70 family RNA polymerase sigma factor [Prevotella sp.]MCI7256113.1 sigma-70 family RNA polymerase sigma factor [Prevotella sp.]MDD5783359.1 sigma-70 family RNA polymerase sigma factor [Prevotella sp.]MDD6862985.1 sigma-70 family RNA polymerase sigma factor [Prevotella sp.]
MKQLNAMTDEELAMEYMSGNDYAFDKLLERYKEKVFKYIFSMTKEKSTAEDIFQDVFVRIIVGLREGKYTSKGFFSYWVSTITRNILIDHFRKDRILAADLNNNNDITKMYLPQLTDVSAETTIVNTQVKDSAVKLMNHLPELQREVVYMKYFEDKSFKEIASLTNVSINTSLGRMRYAILNMRRMAKKYNSL